MYNLTSLQSSNTMYDLVNWANITTDQYLMIFFTIAICIIILLTLIKRQYAFKDSMAAALFVTAIVSAFFAYAGLIPSVMTYVIIILSLFSAWLLYALPD